jgi:MFS family permease
LAHGGPEGGDSHAVPDAPLAGRHVLAATIGNGLEFYDFITYAFFAIQIGHAFFPSHNAYASLMLSLGTFGAGFLTRPIGALVIGAYSDRVGRRPAMMLSFTLMGGAITVLALIPSYATIGIAAPILAIAARMAQGFSLGGEVGPTTAYLLESAPLRSRGLAISWQGTSQNVAATLGALVGVGLSSVLSPAALDGYGWRIAFLLGAATLPYGLWIRRGLPETLHRPEAGKGPEASGTRLQLAGANLRILALGVMVLGAATISNYTFNYMATYAQSALHMAPQVSFLSEAVGNFVGIGALILGGWLSDRIGRRPVMIWSNALLMVLVLPLFFWIMQARNATALLVGSVVVGALTALCGGAFYAALTETLPKRIRGSAFSMVYACAVALFGGTTQLVLTWLLHVTGNPMSPGWYLLAATVVGQVGLMLIPESAPVKTGMLAVAAA